MKHGQMLDGDNELERMLSAIVYDLSLPLIQIKSKAELGNLNKKSGDEFAIISQSGLRLLESYLQALKLRQNNEQLVLQPVSVGSVLNDSAHELSKLANLYKTKIQINLSTKTKPILTNKINLQTALFCLGASLIRSQADADAKNNILVFSAHKGPQESVTTGVYANIHGLSDKELYKSRKLMGRSIQPISSLSAGNSGGVLVADMLLSALYQPLRASKFKQLNGFATQFPISKQLKLV